jgi:hypothetical protein
MIISQMTIGRIALSGHSDYLSKSFCGNFTVDYFAIANLHPVFTVSFDIPPFLRVTLLDT